MSRTTFSEWGIVDVDVDGDGDAEVRGLGGAGSRYSKVWERIMLRSCVLFYVVSGELGMCMGRRRVRWRRGERTESVHLNNPRNMRVSVVVTRRVLLRREVR